MPSNISKKSKLERFIELSNFDKNKPNEFKIIYKNELNGEYSDLHFSNGGDWCRKDTAIRSGYKMATMKKNRSINYLWNQTNEEEQLIKKEFDKYVIKNNDSSGIVLIGVFGVNPKKDIGTRSIHSKIKKYFEKKPCCVCGSNTNLEVDHKNDLYNDPRVLNKDTQEQNDFQSLCKHCNDQKRQVCKETRRTGKRYGATNIPSLKAYGIDFTEGDETFDPNDINAMKGTFWYDPIAFHRGLIKIIHEQVKND